MSHELFADLCDSMEIAAEESGDLFAASPPTTDATALDLNLGINPLVIKLVRIWVVRQLNKLACENRDTILATVNRWVEQFVNNPTAKLVIINVAIAAADTFCGDQ